MNMYSILSKKFKQIKEQAEELNIEGNVKLRIEGRISDFDEAVANLKKDYASVNYTFEVANSFTIQLLLS